LVRDAEGESTGPPSLIEPAKRRLSARGRNRLRLVLVRLALVIPTLFGVSVLVFSVGRVSLANPSIASQGNYAPQAARKAFDVEYHLNDSLPVQYEIWLGNVVRGNFGTDFLSGSSVGAEVKSSAGVTLELGVGAILIATVFGLGLGIIGGWRRRSILNRLIAAGGIAAVSIPTFWLGLVFIEVFAIKLNWLPAGGYRGFSASPVEFVRYMLLPWITLAIGPAGVVARITQVRIAEETTKIHVLTARSLGISRSRIIFKYVVRNALLEPTTLLGIQVGYLLGGAVLVEEVFNLPGLGHLAVQAASEADFPVVQAVALLAVLIFLVVNLLVDILHTFLDVRLDAA
jgi:peptide/nickel transport system permease protein